jgi:hypothetical protein
VASTHAHAWRRDAARLATWARMLRLPGLSRALDRTRTCGLPLRRLHAAVHGVRQGPLTCTDSPSSPPSTSRSVVVARVWVPRKVQRTCATVDGRAGVEGFGTILVLLPARWLSGEVVGNGLTMASERSAARRMWAASNSGCYRRRIGAAFAPVTPRHSVRARSWTRARVLTTDLVAAVVLVALCAPLCSVARLPGNARSRRRRALARRSTGCALPRQSERGGGWDSS